MKFFRHLLGITKLEKGKNQCVREKTGAENIVKEIKQYQKKWLQHVQRMDTNRLPKQALQYKPKGRRNLGRPRKRWRDQLHLEDQGTGNTPKPSWTCVVVLFLENLWKNYDRNPKSEDGCAQLAVNRISAHNMEELSAPGANRTWGSHIAWSTKWAGHRASMRQFGNRLYVASVWK